MLAPHNQIPAQMKTLDSPPLLNDFSAVSKALFLSDSTERLCACPKKFHSDLNPLRLNSGICVDVANFISPFQEK